MKKIPAEVLGVVEKLRENNYEAYLVGGCVRDFLRAKKPKDWDVTTNARPEDIQKIFPETFYENQYGTVGVKTESEDLSLAVVEVTPSNIFNSATVAVTPISVRTLLEKFAKVIFFVGFSRVFQSRKCPGDSAP